jgi:hypothetical protein
MPSHAVSVDCEEKLSTLLATYERMERASARKTEWIELEIVVNQAFIDTVDAAAQPTADSDDTRRMQEHMNQLVSLRQRIEGEIALAKAREERQRGEGLELGDSQRR